ALAARVFGPATRLDVREEVAYGDEEQAGERLVARERESPEGPPEPTAAVLALLSATATPEAETHGAFVDALAAALPAGAPLLALVDESAFVARFGDDPLAAGRREQRRLAWSRMLSAH